MSPLRAECGSSRCVCDHTLCDVGWFTVPTRGPHGEPAEAQAKCLHCFPPRDAEPPETGHPSARRHTDARTLGAEYADHAKAAAGDRP